MSEEYMERPWGKTEKIEYLDVMSRIAQLDGELAWEKDACSLSERSMLVWSSNRNEIDPEHVIDESIAKYGNEFTDVNAGLSWVGLTVGDWLYIEPAHDVQIWRSGLKLTILLRKVSWDTIEVVGEGKLRSKNHD